MDPFDDQTVQGQGNSDIAGSSDVVRAERRRTVKRQKKELIKENDIMKLEAKIALEMALSFDTGPPIDAFADMEGEIWLCGQNDFTLHRPGR